MKNNTIIKEKLVLKKNVRKFINQSLLSIILILILLILTKSNPVYKEVINRNMYEKNIDFIKVKKIVDEYFGNLLPTTNIFSKEEKVFSEKIAYKEKEDYKDGVKLQLESNYLIPVINDGIVVFIGEKDGYGKTVVVEQTDGIDVFYSNLKNININIYDYVKSGTNIGEADNNSLYLVFQKEGNPIDYKKYI